MVKKLTVAKWLRAARWTGGVIAWMVLGWSAIAQTVSTTTVQGTVYEANGQPGSGTLLISWPSFTTAAVGTTPGQLVAAGKTTVTVGSDGFVSVNLAPNAGATPAGEYYTVVLQLSDGSVSTQYWVVPAAATATLASVQAQVMPSSQAVQTVSKAYVDQSITELTQSLLTATGGTLTGPLYLAGDPTTPLQAADKHYVDEQFASTLGSGGGTLAGVLNAPGLNGVYSPVTGGAQATLEQTVTAAGANGAMLIPPSYAGTDTFTNPSGIYVQDLRAHSAVGGSQQYERNVKEFGAVCDGSTDDTVALQAAITYANANGVGLVLPAGTCKTQRLVWHGESIRGLGKQVSGLKGFPGQDVLATNVDTTGMLAYTVLRDMTITVDESVDTSCSPAEGRAAAGSCGVTRPVEPNSMFSPGGNGLTGVAGTGAGWSVGNCAIAMPAATGAAGQGLQVAEIENLEIKTTGTDPLSAYSHANSTHTCGLYLAQWPMWSDFRNIDIRGVGTGIAVPAPSSGLGSLAAGTIADGNRWQNVTIQAAHGFTAVAGQGNVLDNVVVSAGNSAATGEAPTGIVLDGVSGSGAMTGWTVRNPLVTPGWYVVAPTLTLTTGAGAVSAVTVGPEHGLGFDPYGTTVPLKFSGSCTATANAAVNSDGSLGAVTVLTGGVGCSGTTTATVNVAGTWDTAKPVNLVSGQDLTFEGGNLEKGAGGYTVWNAAGSTATGTQMGGGGNLPGGAGTYVALVLNNGLGTGNGYTGAANRFEKLGLTGGYTDNGLGNTLGQASATGYGVVNEEPARVVGNTVTADFALLGGGAANQGFTSLSDLMLTAEDLYYAGGESHGTGSQFGKDATAPVTGSYVKAIGGGWDTAGSWYVRGAAGALVVGKTFPIGQGTWYVAAKADAAGTQTLTLKGSTSGGTVCQFASQTVSLTTAWQVFSIAYNTTTGNSACDGTSGTTLTAGQAVTATGATPTVTGGGTTNVETAWMSFVPAFQQLLLANAPTQPNQAANKAYVDAQIGGSGSSLPLTGGTLTGALNAPVVDGTTDCGLSGSVSGCVAAASSALIPVGTSGTYSQYGSTQAQAQCTYSAAAGGTITSVVPAVLGNGYTTVPAVTVSNGSTGGTGLTVTATVSGGAVTGYTVTNAGTGYTSCPAISVAAPPTSASPIPVLDQRRGMTAYSAAVRVDDFGCAADGVTDDTQCINAAIRYATANGTQSGAITFTQGKTYFVDTITGYVQTAWDDGTATLNAGSGDTCALSNAALGVSGTACTTVAPETPGYLGFSINVPSTGSTGLTIYGNGAAISSNFSQAAAGVATISMASPYTAVFGSQGGIGNWNVYDLGIVNAFVGVAARSGSYWTWRDVSMYTVGVGVLVGSEQYSSFYNTSIKNAESAFVIGGWWGTRAPGDSAQGYSYLNEENLGDDTVVQGLLYYGMDWTTVAESQTAQSALDTWFNKYFFHVTDNQTRLTDQSQAALGVVTDSMWRGIYHVAFAAYSRYGRAVNQVQLENLTVKGTQNYPIVAVSPQGWVIDTMGLEQVGWCNGSSANAVYGSAGCPSAYDSVNTQLPGAILMYNFGDMTVRNAGVSGNPIAEVVAEPQQVTSAKQLSDFRAGLTNLMSFASTTVAPAAQPVETGRLVLGNSNRSLPTGGSSADSGELCFPGLLGGYPDQWCMRAADQTYTSSFAAPRYLALENDGYFAFTGPTALQVPGLRVRPGTISGTDGTLPVTDFAEQAFNIAAGTVSGTSCATIAGISLANAATTDGVLFVQPPGSAGSLQMSGQVTAAGVLSLNVCNPSTAAQTYPAGTYYAFLLDGANVTTTPGVSGGTPTSTSPLTTTVGDLVVGGATGAPTRLAGNSSTSTGVLTQTGTGTAPGLPSWSTAPAFTGSNITGLNAGNISLGTVAVANGGTGGATAATALANLGAANLNGAINAFTGQVTGAQLGAVYQVDQFAGADLGAKLNACVSGLSATYGGTCDARNLTGAQTMSATVTISRANTTVYLPCGTVTTAGQLVVAAGVRNVTLHGCGYQGGSTSSGTAGGTVWIYTGSGNAIQVGDPTYAQDTKGFELDNLNLNTANAGTGAQGIYFYRAQEVNLAGLYLNGNNLTGQVGVTLDGTGNYSGGTFTDVVIDGFGTGWYLTGHLSGSMVGDYANASTFLKTHIDCPTLSGSPIAGTYGINVVKGDGNTWDGGDVEGCSTMFHLGANAENNTVTGLRNENSTIQYQADAGSTYNAVFTGGTFFTGELVDNGSRNSFWDAFHRTANGMNGDWYASQQDATVTNHLRLGTGTGNVRGLLWESQVDNGTSSTVYNWNWGLTDGSSGIQFWNIDDLVNGVNRLSIGQYNTGSSGTNNQTALNSAGVGAVILNGSNGAGTGGVVFGSGGATATTVATVDNAGDANFLGNLQVGGVTTHLGSVTVKNQANAEIDMTLWAGSTAAQKESYIYKNYSGTSQWYLVNDTSNNWAVNSALSGIDSFKAYQSGNSGDTYVDANSGGAVRLNYETGSGTATDIYSGGTMPALIAAFTGVNAIKFPGLAATSGTACLQVDTSGNLTNTGAACGGGSGGSGTVNSGAAGQIAYYASAGTALSGLATTGTGNAVLATGPTFTGSTTTFNNGAAAENDVVLQAGSGAAQNAAVEWNNYAGTDEWKLKTDTSSTMRLTDVADASLDRLIAYQNGQTAINSGAGANAVTINNTSGSGTGGLSVYEGGSNNTVAAFTVSGTGAGVFASSVTASGMTVSNGATNSLAVNTGGGITLTKSTAATATTCSAAGAILAAGTYWTGSASATDTMAITPSCTAGTNGAETLTIGNTGSTGAFTTAINGGLTAQTHAGTGSMGLATGAAAGAGPTIGCASGHVCDGVSGTATLTTGTGPTTGTLATLSFPATHLNSANCIVSVLQSGVGELGSISWTESTTALTLTANASLSASTAYSVKYWCGGN